MEQSLSLNKFISDTGYCSRREADRLIEAGRVMINNRVARTGNRYQPGDEVVVDGSVVKPSKKDKRVMLAFNKPRGITTTSEENIKDNIISFIGYPKRIFPIGRLDKDSEGLIFLTNDGDIVNKILRAGNQHEKEYSVRVHKPLDSVFLKSMSEGVPIMGTRTLPCRIRQTGKQTFSIILTQGLNRQIRRMCEWLGYEVTYLQRTRIMHIRLDKLAVGKWRYLSEVEMETLQESVSDSSSTPGKVKVADAKSGKENLVFGKSPIERKSEKKEGKKPSNLKSNKKGDKKSPDRKSEKKTQPGKSQNENSRKGSKEKPFEKKEKPFEKSYKAFRERRKKK